MTDYVTVSAVGASIIAVFGAYYNFFISQKPKVYAADDKLRKFIENHVKIVEEKFKPSLLYWGGQYQTIFGIQKRVTSPRTLAYERELFPLADGGEIALDWMRNGVANDDGSLLVLLLPGLTSSSQTSYVRTLVQALNRAGASVVVFNNRGIGGVPFKTARTYSASNYEDIRQVIGYLKSKYPNQPLMAIGTSLGGMVLSKYLVSEPKEAQEMLVAAMTISIAWDAVRGSDNLEVPYVNKYVINRELTRGLVNLAKKFVAAVNEIPSHLDMKKVMTSKTVREFDEAVTARQFGFASVNDYYEYSTTNGNIHKFSIPVFGLSAEDDPIQPGHLLPREEAQSQDSRLCLVVTSRGGHLGFLEGISAKSEHYLERFVEQVVRGVRLHGYELQSKL